jgi:uncharacterized protein (DUF2336 family)
MDLRLFEKSPHMASLLTKLYDSHRLYGMARDNNPETRLELSGIMANLLEHQLSPREHELVADVLIALIRQAELDLRQATAERLATMDKVPLRLILHLVNDEIAVADPILRYSPILSDLDLIYIIKSQGAAYWRAIAARENLSEFIIDTLAGTKDPGTALVLTGNERARLTTHALEILTGLAAEHGELARPLLIRSEMPPSLARKLYAHVGQDLKNYIKSFYGIVPPEIENVADEVILEFVDPAEEKTISSPSRGYYPSDDMLAVARRLSELGQLNMTILMEALKKGQVSNFIAMFSVYTGMPARRLYEILQQPSGRRLAIVCRAYNMQKGDFSTIYLLTHRMRSTDRLVNHRDLLAALSYFDKIRPEAARLVLARSGRKKF